MMRQVVCYGIELDDTDQIGWALADAYPDMDRFL